MSSISLVGLLNPPFLAKKGSKYTIISGFRRINACIALGIETLDARIVDEAHSFSDLACLAITENSLQRALNIVETSRACQLLLSAQQDRQELITISQSLGLSPHIASLKKIAAVSRMPAKVQEGLVKGAISLPTAIEMEKLPKENAAAFTDVFLNLKTSLNIQRELLSVITDICERDDVSVPDFFNRQEIREIFSNEKIDGPLKAKQLRAFVKRCRFPGLSKVEQEFNHRLRALKLQPGIQVRPPKFFESESYLVTLSVKDGVALEQLKKSIDTLVQTPELFNCDEQQV